MALEFDPGEGSDSVDSSSVLEKLQIEEYNLYATITMLAQQQRQLGGDVYDSKQKALAKYLSNGEFVLLTKNTFCTYTIV
jgi:hypothetical protein